jgi:ATP synthase protein I
MADKIDPKRLSDLNDRLNAKKSVSKKEIKHEDHYSGAQLGWRMVTELVVGMLMGLGIGYGLDHLFGTMPLFLIIFTILGFAAGVRTMMRSAEEAQMKDTIVDSDDLSIKNKDDNDD